MSTQGKVARIAAWHAGQRPRDSAVAAAFEPAYLRLLRTGELHDRTRQAWARLADCDLCPRDCHVDRRLTTRGAVCRTGERAVLASFGPHFGEERPLVGTNGSGTVFFAWCNLRCQFCQNYEISQRGAGEAVGPGALAAVMLRLQTLGCHNINLVTPSHVVPQILAAVLAAAEQGLRLPLVYNTGGYDALVSLRLLDGVVDIYMPDMKYADEALARTYSKVRNYPAINRAAVREMHRQVGDLVVDEDGVARRGLLVRHLVLPAGIAGTAEIVRFLAEEISPHTYLNVMDQYRPCYTAQRLPPIDRPITRDEYVEAVRLARAAGLQRLDPGADR
jgi:putative pyruvate formate lyase activating enzyme